MTRSLTGKINLNSVRTLKPGEQLSDTDLKGFGVRRQYKAASYFVLSSVNGRLKRITIGKHGSPWNPETARKRAAQLLYQMKSGTDPSREREDARNQAITFDDLAQQFIDVHGAKIKPKTRNDYESIIRRQLAGAFHNKPLNEIDAIAVHRAHASWRKTPRAGNLALSVLSVMLTWAETQGFRQGKNPCEDVKRYPEHKRERYLTGDELIQLGKALADAEANGANPYVLGLIRLLILTGARLGELLTLRWTFVDTTRSCLRLPDSKTGAKVILINSDALAILAALPRIDANPFVFPGHIHGAHLVNIQKPWRTIRHRAGLDDVRIHDLRHSFASVAVDVGGTLPVIGHLLGHRQAQTTARYAHVSPTPARQLVDATGAHIAAALKPIKSAPADLDQE